MDCMVKIKSLETASFREACFCLFLGELAVQDKVIAFST